MKDKIYCVKCINTDAVFVQCPNWKFSWKYIDLKNMLGYIVPRVRVFTRPLKNYKIKTLVMSCVGGFWKV